MMKRSLDIFGKKGNVQLCDSAKADFVKLLSFPIKKKTKLGPY